MTKNEAKARKLAWSAALSDGRVLRFHGGQHFVSYPTIEARDIALAAAKEAGMRCEVVS